MFKNCWKNIRNPSIKFLKYLGDIFGGKKNKI